MFRCASHQDARASGAKNHRNSASHGPRPCPARCTERCSGTIDAQKQCIAAPRQKPAAALSGVQAFEIRGFCIKTQMGRRHPFVKTGTVCALFPRILASSRPVTDQAIGQQHVTRASKAAFPTLFDPSDPQRTTRGNRSSAHENGICHHQTIQARRSA